MSPAGDPHRIPEAWPLMLSRDQLRAYLGGMAEDTLLSICPVAPLDIGVNLVRYFRPAIDAWAATLGPRIRPALREAAPSSQDAAAPAEVQDAATRLSDSLDRVRARAGAQAWPKAS